MLGRRSTHLNKVIEKGLTEKVTFEQRHEERLRGREHRAANAKALRWGEPARGAGRG